MPFNCKPLAAQIYKLKLDGTRQKDFCKQAGISPTTLSKFLTGKVVPGSDALFKLCVALDCTPNDIIGRD